MEDLKRQLAMIAECLPESPFKRKVEKITTAAITEIEQLEADINNLIEKQTRMVFRADYEADMEQMRSLVPVWTQSDMLPESDVTVLVCKPDSDNPVDVGFHDGEAWFDYNGAPLIGRDAVNYWMPLPEPKLPESV